MPCVQSEPQGAVSREAGKQEPQELGGRGPDSLENLDCGGQATASLNNFRKTRPFGYLLSIALCSSLDVQVPQRPIY
jgi:hypothetical protein